jgi:hypothetical protein
MAVSNLGGILGGIGSIFDGLQQNRAITGGVNAQLTGADQAINQIKAGDERQQMQFQPFYDTGYWANGSLANALGVNGEAGKQTTLNNFQNYNPGYEYQRSEGLKALESNANAAGNRLSGGELMALQTRGNDLANQNFGSYLDRLTGLANSGQQAAAQSGALNAAASGNMANLYTYKGDAKAAGSVAKGNNTSSLLGNLAGLFGFL